MVMVKYVIAEGEPESLYVLLLHHHTYGNDFWSTPGGSVKKKKIAPKIPLPKEPPVPVKKSAPGQQGVPVAAVVESEQGPRESFPEAGARELAEETNYALIVQIHTIRRPEDDGGAFTFFIFGRKKKENGEKKNGNYVVFVVTVTEGFDKPDGDDPEPSSLYQMVSVMRLATLGSGKQEHNAVGQCSSVTTL
jgi:8-oxo-dGTP pyrophosphatase MutT (NUDIX family)